MNTTAASGQLIGRAAIADVVSALEGVLRMNPHSTSSYVGALEACRSVLAKIGGCSMNTPTTPENVAARIAAREAIETARIAAIGAAASHYASLRRMNLRPLNQNLLWAEWEFAKALKEWDGDGNYDEMFSDACANLGVDPDGEDVPDTLGGLMTARERDL